LGRDLARSIVARALPRFLSFWRDESCGKRITHYLVGENLVADIEAVDVRACLEWAFRLQTDTHIITARMGSQQVLKAKKRCAQVEAKNRARLDQKLKS